MVAANPLGEVAKLAVAGDTELQRELRLLIKGAVRFAAHTMKHGSDSEKASLMKTLTPHMFEALRQTDTNERTARERAAYESIRAYSRGERDHLDEQGTP